MRRLARSAVAAATLVGATVLAVPARAVDIHVSHAAIERLMTSTLLKDGGRLYLEGTPADACRYAFVQEPKVSGSLGRLVIRFVFSGRAGAQVAGRCVGPGDTIALTASGVPTYAAGVLMLANLELDAPASAYYRVVAGLLEGRLEKHLRLPLRAMLEQSLALVSAGGAVGWGLGAFDVRSLAVDERGVRLLLDAKLTAQ